MQLRSLVLVLLLAAPALAAERTHDVTPDDYFTLATITEIAVSPDGKQVAYCQATWDKKDESRKTDLWVVATDGKSLPRRLTFDRGNDKHPKWSNDGKTIYFLGSRKREAETKPPYDGKPQVWAVRSDGEGESRAVTTAEGGVEEFDYAPKAGAVYYTIDSTATTHDEFAHLREKFPKPEYGHGPRKVSVLHRLDLTSWRDEKLIDEKRYIREFAVTRDGKRIAMVTAFDDSVLKSEGESRVDIWEGEPAAQATGRISTPPTDVYRKNAASPWAWLESLAWSPDGERFAFCAIFDGYPTEVIIGEWKDGNWATKRMFRGSDTKLHVRGYGSPLCWIGPTDFVCLFEQAGNVGIYLPSGSSTLIVNELKHAAAVIYALEIKSGQFMVRGTESGLAGLDYSDGKVVRRLTEPNPQTLNWKLPSIQHITWKAPDGTEVGGVLELPYGYKKGDKLPLIVAIHGGPTTASYANLDFSPHNGRLYLAAAGYAVLCPNYRGSTGYGDKFVTDLIGHENDIEVKDILAGIQHLIHEGIADPERLGVTGWSNGGYLTNCLITLKDPPVKFKAASTGGCILDTVAEWGFNDEPAYPRVFKKGLPWETPDIYRKTSPTFGLGNVKTPTLIHVGGADDRCPPGHSRMLYRALNEYVKVPTELVVYPSEPHGLTKMPNLKAKMEWDLAWFGKYLKGNTE